MADHKFKLCEVAEEMNISEGSVYTILHEHLSTRKLCSKRLPHLLTVNQKQQWSTIQSVVCNCLNATKKSFLHKYVTMDETWIHHFTLESNQHSAEWTVAGESYPKRPKRQTSTDKVLATIFWDAQGILFINYLEKGRTINSEYYIVLLMHLKEGRNLKKQPQMKKKKGFFLPIQCTVSQINRNDGKTT